MRGPKILNSCQLAERGPVALVFLGTRGERCERQLDTMQRVSQLPGSRGVRKLEDANLFFPEEMPDVIAEEALALWGISPWKPKQTASLKQS